MMQHPTELSRDLRLQRETIAKDFSPPEAFLLVPGERLRERISGELFFLARHLAGDHAFGDFLLGEKARALQACNPQGDPHRAAELLRCERAALLATARRQLPKADIPALEAAHEELFRPLTTPPATRVRLLFIGDCLGREIQGFLYAICRRRGIETELVHLGGKTEFLIRQGVRDYQHRTYDAVFYSPVTHESIPEFSRVVTRPWSRRGVVRAAAQRAAAQAIAVAEWLREVFPAPPIFLHNTALLLRDFEGRGYGAADRVRQWAKRVLTRPTRRAAAAVFDALLRDYLGAQGVTRNVHLLDERTLVTRVGEDQLRGVLYNVPDLHPSQLGRGLAPLYASAIAAVLLRPKKVIVSDLDNTLWEGTIGDGPVRQLPQRQQTLKALRDKGYLLAVSSKNDAANVRWDATVLREDDFVGLRINWEPKSGNIRSLASELNLKLKDFVFIDDSQVERALVQQAIPEITVLDAGDESAWESLDQVARMAPPTDGMDRTRMYQEGRSRSQYLAPAADDPERHHAALAGLGLSARIARAGPRVAARVAELVNRTNQFNLTNLRVTDALVRDRVTDPLRPVLCAEVKDRFGDCGLVAAVLLRIDDDVVQIEGFVLSCRVFGFGVETALMNAIKRLARATHRRRLVAHLVITPHNRPCHGMLPDHGFRPQGDHWCCDSFEHLEDPAWLAVTDRSEQAARLVPQPVS